MNPFSMVLMALSVSMITVGIYGDGAGGHNLAAFARTVFERSWKPSKAEIRKATAGARQDVGNILNQARRPEAAARGV